VAETDGALEQPLGGGGVGDLAPLLERRRKFGEARDPFGNRGGLDLEQAGEVIVRRAQPLRPSPASIRRQ